MALPPRTPAAASESLEAKLSSSVASRDLMVSVAYACSTSGSGTSSTTYTSSRGSALSSELDLASQLQCFDDEEKVKRLERAKVLLEEFCHGDGDTGVLEKWLSKMGAGWVLGLADDPSAGTSLLRTQAQRNNLTERWIRALTEITESGLHLEYLMGGTDVPGRVQLLRIFKAILPKMLPFVDVLLAAVDLDAGPETSGVSNEAQVAPSEKLQTLLDVRDALSSVSEGIQLCFRWGSSVELEAQRSKLLNHLSEKEHRLEEAIWNTMEEVRTSMLSDDNDDDNEWGIQTSQGSPDICKITWSLVSYIRSMWDNYSRLNHIILEAAELGSYAPNYDIISSFHLFVWQDKTSPLTTLALEMVSSLEVKLAKRSESFPDHSLRFLFLINNTHFIQQQLHPLSSRMKYHTKDLASKIEDYIEKYLQASWVPVISCLNNDTPHCFRKNSALPKFDLEFHKTYTAQKLWKVPDPEVKTRLRKAIVEQVIPSLTGYLEANDVTSPGVTPQERERMLLELFKG